MIAEVQAAAFGRLNMVSRRLVKNDWRPNSWNRHQEKYRPRLASLSGVQFHPANAPEISPIITRKAANTAVGPATTLRAENKPRLPNPSSEKPSRCRKKVAMRNARRTTAKFGTTNCQRQMYSMI